MLSGNNKMKIKTLWMTACLSLTSLNGIAANTSGLNVGYAGQGEVDKGSYTDNLSINCQYHANYMDDQTTINQDFSCGQGLSFNITSIEWWAQTLENNWDTIVDLIQSNTGEQLTAQYSVYSERLLEARNDKSLIHRDDLLNDSYSAVPYSATAPAMTLHNGRVHYAITRIDGSLVTFSQPVSYNNTKPLTLTDEQIKVRNFNAGDKPSMASYNGKLFLAYKGSGTDNIYTTISYDNGQSWSQEYRIASHRSKRSPTLSVFNGKLYVAFTGVSSKQIYVASSTNGTSWSSATNLGSKSSNPPFLASHKGRIYVAYKGSSTNNLYIRSSSNGTSWNSEYEIGSYCRSDRGPALASYAGDLFLAYKGISTNSIYYTRTSNTGTTWAAPKKFGNNKTSGSLDLVNTSGLNSRIYSATTTNSCRPTPPPPPPPIDDCGRNRFCR